MTVKKLNFPTNSSIVGNPQSGHHQISDTGDISPTVRTSPCVHMWRTMKTMRIPLMQSNRYANWVRCPICGHTHATMVYSATCCLGCKERYNEIVDEHKHQSSRMSPGNVCGRSGVVHIPISLTPAYLNAITTAK